MFTLSNANLCPVSAVCLINAVFSLSCSILGSSGGISCSVRRCRAFKLDLWPESLVLT